MMHLPKRAPATGILLAGVTLLAVIAGASPAQADARASVGNPTEEYVEAHMTIAGFDREVAEAHGYEIRTDANGQEYSVPVGTPEGGITPFSSGGGSVGGDCGTSWVRINGIGLNMAYLETGWNVYAPVTAMNWQVSIIDNGGVSVQGWFQPVGGVPGWSGVRTIGPMTPGDIDAQVQTSSTVRLETGAFCYSGGPGDTGWIYY